MYSPNDFTPKKPGATTKIPNQPELRLIQTEAKTSKTVFEEKILAIILI